MSLERKNTQMFENSRFYGQLSRIEDAFPPDITASRSETKG